ncbi:unnamed protein product [Soboliphyme baturini]|uniref:Uncharacterized protein n=1 Tax=Soboliphyme baturini TaxID=241478 RepID=A0A183J4F4_9BILA|nr:unnamed protein product [Soboliphyme baturini]
MVRRRRRRHWSSASASASAGGRPSALPDRLSFNEPA